MGMSLDDKYENTIRLANRLLEVIEADMHELEADYGLTCSLMQISQSPNLNNLDEEDNDKVQICRALGKIPVDIYQKTMKNLNRSYKQSAYHYCWYLQNKEFLVDALFLSKFNS